MGKVMRPCTFTEKSDTLTEPFFGSKALQAAGRLKAYALETTLQRYRSFPKDAAQLPGLIRWPPHLPPAVGTLAGNLIIPKNCCFSPCRYLMSCADAAGATLRVKRTHQKHLGPWLPRGPAVRTGCPPPAPSLPL